MASSFFSPGGLKDTILYQLLATYDQSNRVNALIDVAFRLFKEQDDEFQEVAHTLFMLVAILQKTFWPKPDITAEIPSLLTNLGPLMLRKTFFEVHFSRNSEPGGRTFKNGGK